MDKLYNHPWFLKTIAFFIAVMLFTIVNVDNIDNVNNQPGALPTITSGSYTLEEVALNVYYDEEKYVISEMKSFVQVNLRGPQNVLTKLQVAPAEYEVFIDLRNFEAGTHDVDLQYQGFPSELTAVNIVPKSILVTIEKKQTISLPIEIDLTNQTEVKEGYTIGAPIVNPVNIEITAAESVIAQVAFAKGFVDMEGIKETVDKSVPIKIFDEQGNELQIDVNPAVVDVKIPVTSPNKEVPLKIKRVGALPEGLSIRTIFADPKNIKVYGQKKVINELSFIEGIEIDLTKITKNTILEVEVPVPSGVEKVSPATVKIVVEVDIEQAFEVDDIPVEIIGLSERMDVSFLTPEEAVMTLTVKGSPSIIERLNKDDIKIYIDVNQLSLGEHRVPIQVNGPQNLTFKINYDQVIIAISEVSSAEEEMGIKPVEETT